MKTIRIKYVDVWQGFDPETYYITQIIKKHFDVVFSEEPDYVLYSCFGHEHLKYTDCIKICFLGENLCPDFNLCDYAIALEDISFSDRYIWHNMNIDLLTSPPLYARQNRQPEDEKRPYFCSYVYSNEHADPFREHLFYAIDQYKPVLCGGKLHHNINIPHKNGNDFRLDRISFEKKFKFSIACENSSHPGYCTEKIFISLLSGTIPIYWGDPLVKKIYNDKAFINVLDYPNLDSVVDIVREIDQNDNLYRDMIQQPVFSDSWDPYSYLQKFESFLCHIFEQPKKDAYRRNCTLRGASYQKNVRDWYNAWVSKESQQNFLGNFFQNILHFGCFM